MARWQEKPVEEWKDGDWNEAATWVLNTLALDAGLQEIVLGLLDTYAPEEITIEHVEAMRDL